MFGQTMRMTAGLAALLLTCELAARLLPVSTATATGYYIDPLILTYPRGHVFRAATGWDLRNPQTLHANNYGFVADRDFEPNAAAVALIGDSFVEASMLPAPDRLGAQLQALLGASRPIYAMGSPGTSLLDHAERVRLAATALHVHDMVVFVSQGDIRQSLCGSGQIAGPCLHAGNWVADTEKQAPASALKGWLRRSAFAQYLFSQVKAAPERLLPALTGLPRALLPGHGTAQGAPQQAQARVRADDGVVDAVTSAFFARVQPFLLGRLVLVIDRPLPGGHAGVFDADSDRFMMLARARGATVLDMAEAYRRHAAQSRLALIVSPQDAHLNRLGVALVATAVADALR